MRNKLAILGLGTIAGLVMTTIVASAKTPDGEPPSVETVCDVETGDAFGLCNAYCEAMDCDSDETRANQRACDRIAQNFMDRFDRMVTCEAQACAEACVEEAQVARLSCERAFEACIATGRPEDECAADQEVCFQQADTQAGLCLADCGPVGPPQP